MEQFDLDYLVASSPANVKYFTDIDCWTHAVARNYMFAPGGSEESPHMFAVFPRDGEPSVILATWTAMFAEQSWIRDVYTYGSPGIVFDKSKLSPIEKKLKDLHIAKNFDNSLDALITSLGQGKKGGRIGIDPHGFTTDELNYVSKRLPGTKIKKAKELMRFIRMVKSKDEIEIMTKALKINDTAMTNSVKHARSGTSMGKLISAFMEEIGKQQGSFDHYFYSPSGIGASTHPNYTFKGNEVWSIDTGLFYNSHNSDTGTTVVFEGKYPQGIFKDFKILADSLQVSFDTMKPGVKISTVGGALRKFLDKHGFKLCSAHGHGVGLEFRDIPVIAPEAKGNYMDDLINTSVDLPLEEGMILNVEAPLWVFSKFSLQVEETVIVTKKGCRRLVPLEREEPIVVS